MKPRQLIRLFLVGLMALVAFAFAPQAAVFAGQAVDPTTLNPPPTQATCEAVGRGTICHVAFTDPPIAEGTGIVCGSGASSFEVFINATRSVVGRRYYDEDRNLTQRHFREVLAGTFTNPLTHAAVAFDQGDTIIHDLAVPGDVNTGTETMTGAIRLHLLHGGIVLIDAGRTVNAKDGTLLTEAGQHPFAAYFVFGDTAALQPLCDALM
jgi:hypothetical protein